MLVLMEDWHELEDGPGALAARGAAAELDAIQHGEAAAVVAAVVAVAVAGADVAAVAGGGCSA